jgi:membrane carboxypeptidase/penicillin-binding protein
VEQASKMYFGKSVRNLDLGQAAFLAGLPAAPSNYSPYTVGIAKAKERQKQVLTQMIKAGYITYAQANQAYEEPLKILPPTNQMKAPHFVMYVKDELVKKYGAKTVEEGGLNVCTTLDPGVQAMSEKVVKDEIASIKRPFNVGNGATLVTKPATGEILAMVGSVDYWDTAHDGNVNLTTSTRQPGSSIKLINYAYALSSGKYTPTSVIQDSPVAYTNAWETYAPVNYDGKFHGSVTLRQALAMSLNIPAVKVLASYGVDKMINLGKKMGITSWNDSQHYGLSLTLGAAEVKMTDMAVVYGTVANGGKRVALNPFYKITDAAGNVLEAKDQVHARSLLAAPAQASSEEPQGEQVLSPSVAYQLVDILSDNDARTPEFGPRSSLYIAGEKVAVKTGTSNNFRDNWTIGFTPSLLVASWVGNNDNQPMSGLASGITGAAPIWNKVMTTLIDNLGTEEFATPSGLVAVKICATNGLLTCARCPREKVEYFQSGTEPTKHCFISTPAECQARKDALEAEGKSADEIVKAMEGCPLADPSSSPQP